MEGSGVFAWQLSEIMETHTPEALASLLKSAGIKWVSWKLAEGIYRYNQIGGNDKVMIDYMQALESVGIASGGWSYNYPEKPGTQSGIIAERVAKFSNHVKFDHWMIDIEAEWKKPNLGKAIDTLLAIDISSKFPFGFCSYRYPKLHPQINYKRFLDNPTVNFNAPQVYWIDLHNPAEQLDASYEQYSVITSKPFVPVGAAFGYGKWEPTVGDMKEFVNHCMARKWYKYGWWSLDKILSKNRMDWLEAIGGGVVLPPGPPPVVSKHVVTTNHCNPRTAPRIALDTDAGEILRGKVFEKGRKVGEWWEVKMYLHETVVEEV